LAAYFCPKEKETIVQDLKPKRCNEKGKLINLYNTFKMVHCQSEVILTKDLYPEMFKMCCSAFKSLKPKKSKSSRKIAAVSGAKEKSITNSKRV